MLTVNVKVVGVTGFVVADEVFDAGLVPMEFIADTLYVYVVLAVRLVSENEVAVFAVFETKTENVPPLVDLSILYPVIGEPPSSFGAVQDKLI